MVAVAAASRLARVVAESILFRAVRHLFCAGVLVGVVVACIGFVPLVISTAEVSARAERRGGPGGGGFVAVAEERRDGPGGGGCPGGCMPPCGPPCMPVVTSIFRAIVLRECRRR